MPSILCKPNVRSCVYEGSPLCHALSQKNPLQTSHLVLSQWFEFRYPPDRYSNLSPLIHSYQDLSMYRNSTFMWRCIVTYFFVIKPKDALSFPNLFLSRNSTCFGQFLCPSPGVFHYTFGTGLCHAGLMTTFKHVQDGRAWKLSSTLHDIYQCRMYSGKLLVMDRGTARNVWVSWQK